jgi:hypothetical protein
VQDNGKILKYFDKSKLIDANNPYKMTEIRSVFDDTYVQTHPEAKYMSYHTAVRKRYKDLPSFLRKFRCKKCMLYGTMKAIPDETKKNMTIALICSNCMNMVHLDSPIDNEDGAGIEKRPELIGRATRMKQKTSQSEKLGIDDALRKNSPVIISSKTFLLKDSITESPRDFNQLVRSHLKRVGYPIPFRHSIIKSVYDAEDMQYNAFMQGKSLVKEKTVYNTGHLVSDVF